MLWYEWYFLGAIAFGIYIAMFITPKVIGRAKIHRVKRFTLTYQYVFSLLLPIYCVFLFPVFFIPIMSNPDKFIKHFAEGD